MARSDMIEMEGVVEEILPSATFRVKIENGHMMHATLGGRLRQNKIRVLQGDKVRLEVSPYDLTRGRIVYRSK